MLFKTWMKSTNLMTAERGERQPIISSNKIPVGW